MKRFFIICFPALFALWIGYSLGYHHGSRDEERAWSSTREASLDRTDGRTTYHFAYRNPHMGVAIKDWPKYPSINRIDNPFPAEDTRRN